MNIFRLTGDLLHLASIFILLVKIISQQHCRGISLKTQFLYVLVFCTRYLDLFYNFASMYNWVMKIIFIVSSVSIVYLMKFKSPFKGTYEQRADTFFLPFIIVPCGVLAVFVNEYFSLFEILWAFSIYLEAVAIVPQLVVVHENAKQQNGWVENLTSHYVFTLGLYRAFYILNWVYRFFTEVGYRDWIVWISGIVQTLIYIDFFYYYIVARSQGKSMTLPL